MTNFVEIIDPYINSIVVIQDPNQITVDISQVGEAGDTGATGPAGTSLTRLYGIGAPSGSVTAVLGNEYLDTANGYLYSLTSINPAVWTYRANTFTDGSGGGQGGSSVTRYFQTIASAAWEFTHSYSYPPEVDTYDQNGEPIIGDTLFPTATTVRVTFGFPMTGSMRLL